MKTTEIHTLGQLKKSGYSPLPIKEELRKNLVQKLKRGDAVFEAIYGFEHTVIPDLERAILSRHNIILLGLRGQAKTRIARLMVNLLDEYIPVISGSELNDDPLHPVSRFGMDTVAQMGDDTPVSWLHRSERYTEKLATPDVSVADLIGDVDPVKAANLKVPYSDERVIHFGLIPRSHRCIFVINELPDLQARIQVALFNILQEGDMQIRGFKVRLHLDVQFVFTANPEDYTNRGAIITPLKDRIESQILTHYPKDIEVSKSITRQEAAIHGEQSAVQLNELAEDLIEHIAMEARKSEFVDQKSGVSARMTITAKENLVSAAERRSLLNGEKQTFVRIADFRGVIPSVTGKLELVYEGEQEGPFLVALNLIGKAIRNLFIEYFPAPKQSKKLKSEKSASHYEKITEWFSAGNHLDILNDSSESAYRKTLDSVPGLKALVTKRYPGLDTAEAYFMMEFVLHGLCEYSLLSRSLLQEGDRFKDLFSSVFNGNADDADDFDPDLDNMV